MALPLESAWSNLTTEIQTFSDSGSDFWTQNQRTISSPNVVAYFRSLSEHLDEMTTGDLDRLIKYCACLPRFKKEGKGYSYQTTKSCQYIAKILSVPLSVAPPEKLQALWTAFDRVMDNANVVVFCVINAKILLTLSHVDVRSTRTGLTALESLLNEFENCGGEGSENWILSLAKSLLSEDNSEAKIKELFVKLSAISSEKSAFAVMFEQRLRAELVAQGFAFVRTPLDLAKSVANEEKYNSNIAAFKRHLKDATFVKQLLESPRALHFLLAGRNNTIGLQNEIDGISITTKRATRAGLVSTAIQSLMKQRLLTSTQVKESLDKLAEELAKPENNDAKSVILGSFDKHPFLAISMEGDETGLSYLAKAIEQKESALKLEIKSAEREERFEELLQKTSTEMASGCEKNFGNKDKIDQKRGPFFNAVLEASLEKKDETAIKSNLKKVAEALMSPETIWPSIRGRRQNFWDAVSSADIPIFPIEHRITLVGHILDCLKNQQNSAKIEAQAVKFIFEQLTVIKQTNQNIDVLLPLLLELNNFKKLKALYSPERPKAESDSTMTTDLKSIFSECYTHKAHDTLYKYRVHDVETDKVPDWEFLVKIKRGGPAQWASSNESTITDKLLKLREEQDYREAKYQKEGAGFTATWNLLNNRHTDNNSFQNFFKTIATYFWATRPLPAYMKEKADVIVIDKELEEKVAKSGPVPDDETVDTERSDAVSVYAVNSSSDAVINACTAGKVKKSANYSAYMDCFTEDAREKFLQGEAFQQKKRSGVVGVDSDKLVALYRELDNTEKSQFIAALKPYEVAIGKKQVICNFEIKGIYEKLLSDLKKEGKNTETDVRSEFCLFIMKLSSEQLNHLFADKQGDFLWIIKDKFSDNKEGLKTIVSSLYDSVSNKRVFMSKAKEVFKNAEEAQELCGLPAGVDVLVAAEEDSKGSSWFRRS